MKKPDCYYWIYNPKLLRTDYHLFKVTIGRKWVTLEQPTPVFSRLRNIHYQKIRVLKTQWDQWQKIAI